MESRGHQLGVYVSIPFCASKCTFCNFASDVFPQSRMERYVRSLEEEIHSAASRALQVGVSLPRSVDTLYFGGGTPSLLPPEMFVRIADALRAAFELADDAEWTIECAPGQLAPDLLRSMASCGVNRLSFGAQSFHDREIASVGRLHTAQQIFEDLDLARQAGIANLSVDLIAGLPGQSFESFASSVHALIRTGVPHASVYMLEVDDESRLGRELLAKGPRYGAAEVPGEQTITEMYQYACSALAAAGLGQYEISNFAQPGFISRHNLRYWQRRPYIGLGMDAHSALESAGGVTVRFANANTLDAYEQGRIAEAPRAVSAEEQLDEEFFLGLRCQAGVDFARLDRIYGSHAVAPRRRIAEELVRDGLMSRSRDTFSLTPRGILVSNDVFTSLLLDALAAH